MPQDWRPAGAGALPDSRAHLLLAACCPRQLRIITAAARILILSQGTYKEQRHRTFALLRLSTALYTWGGLLGGARRDTGSVRLSRVALRNNWGTAGKHRDFYC